MNAVQIRLDQYLSYTHLKSVRDLEFIASENVVNVYRRKLGQKNAQIDVSDCSSPSEVLERVISCSCVY